KRSVGASFPHLRLPRGVARALAQTAAKSGVHRPVVVRQALSAYVVSPWPLSRQRERDGKPAVLGAFKADPNLVAAFQALAGAQGVRESEAIRQVLARHLESLGQHRVGR